MSTNKYYTPEIEEFHEGFEFEYKSRVRKGVIKFMEGNHEYFQEWKEGVFTIHREDIKSFEDCYYTPGSLYDINSYLKDSAIRVKHLDREDIESLGFKWDEDDIYYSNDIWGRFSLHHYPEVNAVVLYDGPKEYHFRGVIKNKSDLKRILKQLGICHK